MASLKTRKGELRDQSSLTPRSSLDNSGPDKHHLSLPTRIKMGGGEKLCPMLQTSWKEDPILQNKLQNVKCMKKLFFITKLIFLTRLYIPDPSISVSSKERDAWCFKDIQNTNEFKKIQCVKFSQSWTSISRVFLLYFTAYQWNAHYDLRDLSIEQGKRKSLPTPTSKTSTQFLRRRKSPVTDNVALQSLSVHFPQFTRLKQNSWARTWNNYMALLFGLLWKQLGLLRGGRSRNNNRIQIFYYGARKWFENLCRRTMTSKQVKSTSSDVSGQKTLEAHWKKEKIKHNGHLGILHRFLLLGNDRRNN